MKLDKRILLQLFLMLLSAGFIFAGPLKTDEQSILSPRLKKLQNESADQNLKSIDLFWQEVAGRGTPLVEPIENSAQYVYVTFLWKGNPETKNVVVLTLGNTQFGNAEFFAESQLANLPGTNIWFKTYRLRNDARFSYRMAADDSLEVVKSFAVDPKRVAAFKADPLNKKHFTGINGDCSVVELEKAPPPIWSERMPGVAEGKLEKLPFTSQILNNKRDIWVYTPPNYANTKNNYNLLVTLDGSDYVSSIPTPTILDNLIGKGKIPPTVAVMVGNADGARVKELWHNAQFNEFFAKELIPWVRKNYRVTDKANKTILAGSSLGGNAVVYLAMRHPEIFGSVLSQSGGFMYRERREDLFGERFPGEFMEADFPENEWLTRELAARPKLPVRFYLEAGLLEDAVWRVVSPPHFAYPSLLVANRHLRDVLKAKGNDVVYHEFNGAHESLSWQVTFPDGLMALAGGKNAK